MLMNGIVPYFYSSLVNTWRTSRKSFSSTSCRRRARDVCYMHVASCSFLFLGSICSRQIHTYACQAICPRAARSEVRLYELRAVCISRTRRCVLFMQYDTCRETHALRWQKNSCILLQHCVHLQALLRLMRESIASVA